MSYCAEIVTYSIAAEEAEYLRLRAAAIQEVKAAHPDLLAVPFCGKRSDGSWADVWIYRTAEAADAANNDAPNLPHFMAMFAALRDVSIEALDFPEGAVSPLDDGL
jgi:hypothetical protein